MTEGYDWEAACSILKDGGRIPDTPVLLRNFKRSSEEGCLLCRVILSVIEEILPGWTMKDEETKRLGLGRSHPNIHQWDGTINLEQDLGVAMRFRILRYIRGSIPFHGESYNISND